MCWEWEGGGGGGGGGGSCIDIRTCMDEYLIDIG